jgi:polyferredoxin
VLLAMISLLATAFFMRSLVGFDVSKDRVLYRENAEGRIENVYSLKIMNKDQRDHTYVLDAAGLPDLACKASARSRWPPAISSACRWNCRAHRNNCRRAPTR